MKLLSGRRNQCQGCKAYFNSDTPFDMHRTGDYGVDRRCRTSEEMLGLGMSVNADGFWISKKRQDGSWTKEMEDEVTS